MIDPEIGWRAAFVIGGVIGILVVFLRRFIPESPRWLMTHGRPEEADRVTAGIERRVEAETGVALPPARSRCSACGAMCGRGSAPACGRCSSSTGGGRCSATALMASQAFCYNAVLFTYALILTRFYGVPSSEVGWFMLPFALGNFAGPLLLGRFFDTLGRKTMITATYALTGVAMAVTGLMFSAGMLDAVQQTAAWTGIFFVASAAASSAYLTVGESFPLEVRAIAISLFYAFGTAVGGIAGPALFGALIETGERREILWGYLLGGALMLIAAGFEAVLGVAAERRSLEHVAPPLSAA